MTKPQSDALAAPWQCYQLLRVLERAFHGRLCACLDGFELDVFDSMLLMECHTSSSDGVAQRELTVARSTSAAKVSVRLEFLRNRGLLESWRPTDDRRRQCWRVTALGSGLARELEQRISSSFGHDADGRLRALSEALQQSLVELQQDGLGPSHNESRAA